MGNDAPPAAARNVSRLQTVDAVVVKTAAATGQYDAPWGSFLQPARPAKRPLPDFKAGQSCCRRHRASATYFHLQALGIPFTPHAFPDHHPYSATDLAFTDCDAVLLTEKDAVKCTGFADARYWVLRVDAQIDSALTDLILRKIKSHGSTA
jgi:tetraacyldisaccharide 4'-kinase